MKKNREIMESASKIALLAMFILFVMGVVFYKERVLFADAAFRMFNMINYTSFDTNRLGSFVVQLLPFIAVRLHAPVILVLFLYGVSFNLFYLVAVWTLVYRFREYALAVLVSLFYFLFISDSFMWVSETFIGVGWLALFFGTTFHLANKKVHIAWLLVPFTPLAFIAIFTHFVVIIPLTFQWVYFIIDRKTLPFSRKLTILFSCILLAITGIKFFFTPSRSMDENLLHGVTHFSLQDIIDSFGKPVVITFLYRCLVNYWAGVIVFMIGMFTLLRLKRWALAGWVLVSVIGYLSVMGLTYGSLDEHVLLLHIESEWAGMGVVVAAPFVLEWLPRQQKWGLCVLIAIFAIRLGYIACPIPSFTWRTRFLAGVLAHMKKKRISKLALYMGDKNLPRTKLYWAFPYESILQSAMNGDQPQLTFFYVNPDDHKTLDEIKSAGVFYNSWGVIPCRDLNPGYFSIDSMHPYQVMTYDELIK